MHESMENEHMGHVSMKNECMGTFNLCVCTYVRTPKPVKVMYFHQFAKVFTSDGFRMFFAPQDHWTGVWRERQPSWS